MRLLLAIVMLALIIAMGPTHAEVPASSTVSALAALCKSDMKNCEDQIGVIIMTGVQAQKIPSCTIRLNLPRVSVSGPARVEPPRRSRADPSSR